MANETHSPQWRGAVPGQADMALNQVLSHAEDSLAARHAGEQRLRRFAAGASYELRTPLAFITGCAELATRDPGVKSTWAA